LLAVKQVGGCLLGSLAMKIERITIKNYKVFRQAEIHDLPNMCVFLGANGAGKTTFFDVFGFLSDALKTNVRTALAVRGGFKEVLSRGVRNEPIEISIKFRNDDIESGKICARRPNLHE
jgi:predicted ATPase